MKVYIAIKSFMNKETHECFPSRQLISKMTDIPVARVSVETDRLEKMGWIKKTGAGDGLPLASTRCWPRTQSRNGYRIDNRYTPRNGYRISNGYQFGNGYRIG